MGCEKAGMETLKSRKMQRTTLRNKDLKSWQGCESPALGFAQREGNRTQKAQGRAQKAQEMRAMTPSCAFCVRFVLLVFHFPFALCESPPLRGTLKCPFIARLQ